MTLHGRRCWKSVVAASFGIGVAIALFAAPGTAQEYKSIPPRVDEKQATLMRAEVATILRDTVAPNAAAMTKLDEFFKGYLFSDMTNYKDPVKLGELAKRREELFQRYINSARSPQARDHIMAGTVQAMTVISKGAYHPAVRYNAALILGQLEAAPGKPLPAGAEALLTLLENEQFNNVPVPTAVKVAALIGLQRQSRLGLDAALTDRATKAALAIVNSPSVPEDTTAKVFGWVRRQAAAVLAIQSAQGITPPAYAAIVSLINDKKLDLDDRCAAAQLLQPPLFEGAQGVDGEAAAVALGRLANDVLAEEAEEAEDYLDEIVGNPGGMMGFDGGRFDGGRDGEGGGFNFDMMGAQDLGPKYEKRRMMDRMLTIAAAADAVAKLGSDELKGRLGELATLIREVAESAADDTDTTVTNNVVNLKRDVSELVAAWAPAEAPAEEAPGDEIELPAEAPAGEGDAAPAAEAPAAAAGG